MKRARRHIQIRENSIENQISEREKEWPEIQAEDQVKGGESSKKTLSGGGGKPSFPSPSAGDLRELPRVQPG